MYTGHKFRETPTVPHGLNSQLLPPLSQSILSIPIRNAHESISSHQSPEFIERPRRPTSRLPSALLYFLTHLSFTKLLWGQTTIAQVHLATTNHIIPARSNCSFILNFLTLVGWKSKESIINRWQRAVTGPALLWKINGASYRETGLGYDNLYGYNSGANVASQAQQ